MLGKTDLRVLFCLRRCWEATCKQDFLAERNQLRSYWCLALRTGTCRCCPLSEGAHEPLQNAPWPNTDLEATFTSDRNLQDATADISPCPKEFGCIPSYYLGRLNCKQFSHFCILWIWEEISELRIAFQAASVFFLTVVSKWCFCYCPTSNTAKFVFFQGNIIVVLLFVILIRVCQSFHRQYWWPN